MIGANPTKSRRIPNTMRNGIYSLDTILVTIVFINLRDIKPILHLKGNIQEIANIYGSFCRYFIIFLGSMFKIQNYESITSNIRKYANSSPPTRT